MSGESTEINPLATPIQEALVLEAVVVKPGSLFTSTLKLKIQPAASLTDMLCAPASSPVNMLLLPYTGAAPPSIAY